MASYDGPAYAQRWLIEAGTSDQSHTEYILTASEIARASRNMAKEIPTGLVRCLLFATCGDILPIWAGPEQGDDVDILQLPHLFPNGYVSYRIPSFPILDTHMLHNWRIYVSSRPDLAPTNISVSQNLGHIWRGNIVLAKYGNATLGEKDWLKDVRTASVEFAMALLDGWLKQFLSICPQHTQQEDDGFAEVDSADVQTDQEAESQSAGIA